MERQTKIMIFTYGYLFYLPINLIYAVVILFFGKKRRRIFPIIYLLLYLQYTKMQQLI